MLKKIGAIFLAFIFIILAQNESYALWFKKKVKHEEIKETLFVPLDNVQDNVIWVGTFQLVWNDLVDEIIKAPVIFSGYKSDLAEKLNKQGFNTSYLSEESYYKKWGKINFKLKKEIENSLKKKFNEKSDILNGIDWNSDGMLVYAMLKKDFEFIKQFKELSSGDFTGETVKFFGIDSSVRNENVRDNAEVLFYNSEDDFSVKLKTKNNEEVILMRTDEDKSFEELLSDLNKKTASFKEDRSFKKHDILKIPYIKFDERFEYSELENMPIVGTDYIINNAIQTVKFNLDNKGGSLKSEAAIIATMSLEPSRGRNFIFDKPFVLFLKEKDKKLPYFIVRFENAALFVKD